MSGIVDWLKPKVLFVGAIFGLILAAAVTVVVISFGGNLYVQWFGVDFFWGVIGFVCTLLIIGLIGGFVYGWFFMAKNPLINNKPIKQEQHISNKEESK
jgi:hypothetical protein